jgi:hypothetical protein
MPNYSTDGIRIFRDDDSKTVENALSVKFYGAGSVGMIEQNGYPDITLSNVDFNVADYEITPPTSIGFTVSIENGSTTLYAGSASPGPVGSFVSPNDVGKFLWDARIPTNLKLIGKIATVTFDDEIELDSPYFGTTLNEATCYISSSANNNSNFSNEGNFIILIKTAIGANPDKRRFPSNLVGGLKLNSTVNSEYNVNGELNPAYISLLRISDKGVKGKPTTAAPVPANITRLNSYIAVTNDEFFSSTEDFPYWVAYKINPFGASSVNFNKNTTYSLEITESLPYYEEFGTYSKKASAAAGYF